MRSERRAYSAQERYELWRRWKQGDRITDIARSLEREPGSVYGHLMASGGIQPKKCCRHPLMPVQSVQQYLHARAEYRAGSGSSGTVPDQDRVGLTQTTITTYPDGHMIVTQSDAGTDITVQRFSDTDGGEAAEAYRERMFERLRGSAQH